MTTAYIALRGKEHLVKGDLDFETHPFKIILMKGGFVFNNGFYETHDTLADIAEHQCPTGNGYTQDNKLLAGVVLQTDYDNGKIVVTWDNVSWIAQGGYLGSDTAGSQLIAGAIIYDDFAADKYIIGYIAFTAPLFITDGNGLELLELKIEVA